MRKAVPLSPRLDGELESYVTAARAESRSHQFLTAAAIGLASLSIAPALNAEIVYTPANQSIGGKSAFSTLPIDLNNDGIADVILNAYSFATFTYGPWEDAVLWASGLQSNQVLDTYGGDAVPGQVGEPIGGGNGAILRFQRGGGMAQRQFKFKIGSSGISSSNGLWLHATNRYLGVKFYINGEIHYGWARLNAAAGYAQLTGYAYETEPNKPIRAGVLPTPEADAAPLKPATLGVLAMGAVRHGD